MRGAAAYPEASEKGKNRSGGHLVDWRGVETHCYKEFEKRRLKLPRNRTKWNKRKEKARRRTYESMFGKRST